MKFVKYYDILPNSAGNGRPALKEGNVEQGAQAGRPATIPPNINRLKGLDTPFSSVQFRKPHQF